MAYEEVKPQHLSGQEPVLLTVFIKKSIP